MSLQFALYAYSEHRTVSRRACKKIESVIDHCEDYCINYGRNLVNYTCCMLPGGSVAEWLACWTQAQKGLCSNRSRDVVG